MDVDLHGTLGVGFTTICSNSMNHLLYALLILFVSTTSNAQSFADKLLFTDGAFVVPNEDHFYLFDSSLAGKTDVLISVGTFRTLENASRGNFSNVVMVDIDPGIVQFNNYQIDVLRRSPTRRDFLLNFIGLETLFDAFPALDVLFAKAEFNQMANFLNSNHFEDLLEGDFAEKKSRFLYLLKILKLSDVSRGSKGSFLLSEDRYQKLYRLAVENKIVSVRANLTDASFAKIANVLREQNLRVSVLDVSNSPDYFLHSTGHLMDGYRLNLQLLPFTPDADVLFTTGMMIGPVKMGLWHYVSFPARDYIHELGALLRLGSYSLFLHTPRARARALVPGLKCSALF
jgi:hypothetical protein